MPQQIEPSSVISLATRTAEATLQMRCPKCEKLFSVQSHLVAAAVAPLKFQCTSCQSRFLVPHGSTHETGYLETREIPANERTAVQKAPAHLLKAKSEKVPGEISFAGRRELAVQWAAIMNDYDNVTLHEQFISECYSADCLPFASQKYARILSAAPTEDIARSMRRRIIALASFRAEPVGETHSRRFRIPAMNGLVIALGSAAMTMGFMIPGLKDLAGLGLATVLCCLGVRYFLRPD